MEMEEDDKSNIILDEVDKEFEKAFDASNIETSMIHPKFLHSNSTSHVWAFGAIAELIDNATDPDVQATSLWMDCKEYSGQKLFFIIDNGFGMSRDTLHRMLSFGYSDKVATEGGHIPIGRYGNGFKSGSMRLGTDALVFTNDGNETSIGFLSQTFLTAINSESVKVPMVTYIKDKSKNPKNSARVKLKTEKDIPSLQVILKYGPHPTEEELLNVFTSFPAATGTIIMIFNLREQFDTETDATDIRIASLDENVRDPQKKQNYQRPRGASVTFADVPLDYSLKEYCSVLYLKPRMKIFIGSKKVRTKLVEKDLSRIKIDSYAPMGHQKTKITFGLNRKDENTYGMMLYNRNRLIKPYVRVGMQLQPNSAGVGVIGVMEADFLQPTHNKQDFDDTKEYRLCMQKLAELLNFYWTDTQEPEAAITLEEDTWVQCDACQQWRNLRKFVPDSELEEKWYCHMNDDPVFNLCVVPEEKENPELIPKTKSLAEVRKRQNRKKQKEKDKKKMMEKLQVEEKLRKIEERQKNLELQEQELKLSAQRKAAMDKQNQEEARRIHQQKIKEIAEREKEVKRQSEQLALSQTQQKNGQSLTDKNLHDNYAQNVEPKTEDQEMEDWLNNETSQLGKRTRTDNVNSPASKKRKIDSSQNNSTDNLQDPNDFEGYNATSPPKTNLNNNSTSKKVASGEVLQLQTNLEGMCKLVQSIGDTFGVEDPIPFDSDDPTTFVKKNMKETRKSFHNYNEKMKNAITRKNKEIQNYNDQVFRLLNCFSKGDNTIDKKALPDLFEQWVDRQVQNQENKTRKSKKSKSDRRKKK